jgi:hypothetical protein
MILVNFWKCYLIILLSLKKIAPYLNGWKGQECIFMWWNIYTCATPIFSYNFICLSPLSQACNTMFFCPFHSFSFPYKRKVEANKSKPSRNLWCYGINILNIKIMMKFTKLHFMSCFWFVVFLFKVVSILQYCNLSLVWESLLIYPPDYVFLEWHGCFGR